MQGRIAIASAASCHGIPISVAYLKCSRAYILICTKATFCVVGEPSVVGQKAVLPDLLGFSESTQTCLSGETMVEFWKIGLEFGRQFWDRKRVELFFHLVIPFLCKVAIWCPNTFSVWSVTRFAVLYIHLPESKPVQGRR